jgi:GNAT superfamily N-acetyltransferase
VSGDATHRIVAGALAAARSRAIVSAALVGKRMVGLALSDWDPARSARRLLAIGIAPAWRRRGLGASLLGAHLAEVDRREERAPVEALITTAERDAVEPMSREARSAVAGGLLARAGFRPVPVGGELGRADPLALRATRPG